MDVSPILKKLFVTIENSFPLSEKKKFSSKAKVKETKLSLSLIEQALLYYEAFFLFLW